MVILNIVKIVTLKNILVAILWIRVFSVPLGQVYEIKHLTVESVFASICERMGLSKELSEAFCCNRNPPLLKVGL